VNSGAPIGPHWLAFDIGGTKTDVAVVSSDGVFEARGRVSVPGNGHLIDEVINLARRLGEGFHVVGAGVATAGPLVDHGRRVSPLNIPQWRDFPLRDLLEASLEIPVRVDGDVRALALAERRFGGAKELDHYASLVVSTGVGGAVVLDGRLLGGRTGNAGHLGHVIVEPEGHDCSCGSRGCLEAEVSGWALERDSGQPAHLADEATRIRVGELVGRGVGSFMAVFDLETCFVSGSVALGFGATFFRAANEEASRVARLSYCERVEIVPSALGTDGPLLGAACVAWSA
jgi:glucokinase